MEMYGLERRRPGPAGALKSRQHHLDEDYFAHVGLQDYDKAYIVGFILGDGTLIDRGRSRRVQIGLAEEDGDLLDCIAALLGDATLVRRNIKPCAPAEQPKALLRIDSVRLVNDLLALGIPLGRKSGSEPSLSFESDRLTWSFIRGVFDADGCIRVYERSGYVGGKLYGPYRRQSGRSHVACRLYLACATFSLCRDTS